uniref:hypothetical protein n=1 Tax=Polynucleobacter sp. TaxID=2029855 RepID=UPI00404866D8
MPKRPRDSKNAKSVTSGKRLRLYRAPTTYRRAFGGGPNALNKGPLPQTLSATFVYADDISLNAGAGVADSWVFSANGLTDPNITGTGAQPRGFDEMMALYRTYLVTHAKITVWAENLDGSNSNFVAISPLTNPAYNTSGVREILENRAMVCKQMSTRSGGPAVVNISMYADIAKFL